ncbi:MAG: hypothetical protein RIS64_2877 [Bacteroidota bacterium]|jgi:hypothetical protein
MYIFKNSNLQEDFPFLIHEASKLHPNDPNKVSFIRIAQDLLFLDKQATLAFVEGLEDSTMTFYLLSSSCWVRFPSQSLVSALKKQIDKFKDTRDYELFFMRYQEAVKYLADMEADKINTRAYRESLKTNK